MKPDIPFGVNNHKVSHATWHRRKCPR